VSAPPGSTLTPLEMVNERIHEITELVRGHPQDFLAVYGITLNDVKVLMRPRDERMRELISLRAFGLSEMEAVRYYVAVKMAERGLVSAPNMAAGEPFNIGLTGVGALPGMPNLARRARSWVITVPDTLADRLRSLLASDVCTEKGRLRPDDQLVRERVVRGLGEATASIRQLIRRWRADEVPPSTREQPFPPAEVMEPIRKAERLIRGSSRSPDGLPQQRGAHAVRCA